MSDAFVMDGDSLFKRLCFEAPHVPRIVRWSLEQRCPLRQGDFWESPATTHKQLRPLALLSQAKIHPTDDLAVTESTDVFFSTIESLSIPDFGYRLSEACQPPGGWSAVRDTCGSCPANVQLSRSSHCVGCHGHLGFQVCDEFDDGLEKGIEAAGLQQRVDELFPQTKQLWTRFWMASPWRAQHAEVMLKVFSERSLRVLMGLGPMGDQRNDSFLRFELALNLCHEQDIPLHVELLPPFADTNLENYAHHCGICKAPAPNDWHTQVASHSDPSRPLTIACSNCESSYDPAVSSSDVERLESEEQPKSLQALLGTEEYWRFVSRSLLEYGHPEQLVERHVARERARRAKNPDTWQQRKHLLPAMKDFPCYGPPCEHCGEYLWSPDATDCIHCGKASSSTTATEVTFTTTSVDASDTADKEYENPYDDFTAEQMAEEFDRPEEAVRVLRWALQRECPYRQGNDWESARVTHEQLAGLVDLSGRLGRDFEGICVTDWTTLYYTPDDYLSFPDRGYRVDDAFAAYGGVEQATQKCGMCLANVNERREVRLAGCHGELKICSDHPLFVTVLQEAIKNTGMEAGVAELFPATNPVWYGLWIRSPIRLKQAKVLYPILKEALENYKYGYTEGEEAFLDALARVRLGNFMPMHVELLPPDGFDPFDFEGFHCPFCKAPTPDTNLPTAKGGHISQLPSIDCPACGMSYSPLESRVLRQEPPPEPKDELLEDILGTEEYWEFARRYLMRFEQSVELVEQYCRWERDRREENPQTWERKNWGYVEDPDYGPPCSDCREYLPSPEAKLCKRCGAEKE